MAEEAISANTDDQLMLLSQRVGELWSWRLDAATKMFTAMRPVNFGQKYGISQGPVHLDQVLELFQGTYREQMALLIRQSLETGKRFSGTLPGKVDDESRYFHFDAEPEYDDEGAICGLFGVTRDVTREHRQQILLSEQKELLERAQQVARIGHWRSDQAEDTLTCSPVLHEILGVSGDAEITIETMLGLAEPRERGRIRQIRESAIAAREKYAYEADIVRPDGQAMALAVSGEPQFDANGELTGYFGTMQDVTERVRAERASREKEQQLQNIFDAMDKAGIGIGLQNNKGEVEIARPALLEMAGLESDAEIIGKRWSSLEGKGGADIRNPFGDAVAKAVADANDHVPNMEIEWVRPDGHRISVLARLAPLPGGSRAMIVLDQTEQKETRREIEAREFRTRAILDAIDAAGIGYCVEDIEGRIFDVSEHLRDMLGLGKNDDLLGRKWTETLNLPDEVRWQIDEENRTYGDDADEAFVYPEFVLQLPNGDELQLHARSTSLPGIGRLVLVIDQTERWHLEQHQAELERHMQHVQKMEAVGQLAGGVAHEINNMLHPIRTFTRAAARSDDPERREHLLSRVMECADKAARIVRETLDFARGDDSAASEHDLNALLSGVVGFSRDLPMRGIELEFALPAENMRALVNETEFTQVIVNLLRNATDAMGDAGTILVELGSLEVGVGGNRGLPPGRYAQVSVEDSGAGMSAEVIDRVFEPFFTTKEPGKGTGLGLSVVYGIVKRWKGDIRIVSEPDKGTRVSLILPRTDGAAPAETGIS